MRGFTLGLPSAKMVSCTVHCRLSRLEAAPRTQTVWFPVSSYVLPLVKQKGKGIWSMFAIWDSLKRPTSSIGCHSPGFASLLMVWWKARMVSTLSSAGLWLVLVGRRKLMLCRALNRVNHPSEQANGTPGSISSISCLALTLNQKDLTLNPFLLRSKNSSFSTSSIFWNGPAPECWQCLLPLLLFWILVSSWDQHKMHFLLTEKCLEVA